MVRHKGSQLAALQHTLHRQTVGTHPGTSQLAAHGQSCSPSALLSPPSVTTAHCGCRTVQPSEIITCYIGLTDTHVSLYRACVGTKEDVKPHLLQLLLLEDLYSYLWFLGVSLSPFTEIIQGRQVMKQHFS